MSAELAGQSIIILREGTSRSRGKDAQRANITAAKVIAESVKTSLGPKGMDKMLVDGFGDVTITNDGATILKEMEVQHPAAKMMVEVAKTQDDEVGDGTTTSVVVAGELLKKAEELLRFVGLFDLRDEYAKNLSGGQKKILELARALMADPTMILLDEPVAGVNPALTVKILDLIAQLKAQGKTFFLIEHDMDVVMNRCDWIIVMHQGRKLAEGKPKDVKRDERVVEAYLGE